MTSHLLLSPLFSPELGFVISLRSLLLQEVIQAELVWVGIRHLGYPASAFLPGNAEPTKPRSLFTKTTRYNSEQTVGGRVDLGL